MQQPEKPLDELARLTALHATALLDSAPEPRFDRLTALVKQCLNSEIVLVSLVDQDRQWFKSRQGLNVCETGRDISFCGHAILTSELFQVSDTRCDARFADNPLVTQAPYIRFYAGAPLHYQGQRIGTLCLIDIKPRTLTEQEQQILRGFADAIEQEIHDRLQEQFQHQLSASELMYRSVLEGTRIGTWQWNVQTGATVFNERWAEIIGYRLEELQPVDIQTWRRFAHPDDLEISGKVLAQHFAGELAFYDCQCRMRHKAGHWVWVHDRGRVISWTDEGLPLMMYGTHADISTEKENELGLKSSRDQFQALVANIPGITYRCRADKNWTMLYMSGSIDPLSGYPASDFINNHVRSYASVIHPDDCARLEDAVAKAIATKENWLLQYRVIHKNGTVCWVEERGRAEYDAAGLVTFLDGFILDVTTEKGLQQQLLKLTSQLPGVVYQYQQWPDGRAAFPYASDNIKAIYGVYPDEVKQDASSVFAKIYPDDLSALADSIRQSAQTLSVWQHQYRLENQQGELIWLSGRATPERQPDGSTLWHGYIENITAHKQYYLELERVNNALQLSQQRLEMASDTALIGFWQASLVTGELYWSPVIFKIFGFDTSITPSVALFKSTLHPDDRECVAASEHRAFETGIHDVVHRIIRPDGTIRWVHEIARLLPVDENPAQILVGSVQDVTERMQLQQMKDAFISTVSHELRTPLTAISGALSIVNSGKLGALAPQQTKLLAVAENNSKRLNQLINDLLDIEKLSLGKMPFNLQQVSIKAETELAVSNMQPYAASYKVRLTIQPAGDVDAFTTDVTVVADSLRLQQVFANLLSNAIKFSAAGDEVIIAFAKQGNVVKVSITDQGVGIAPEFRSKVFERFAQADNSNTRKTGGTGLGLAICKEIIEKMQGKIGYHSEIGQGTVFYFELPCAANET